MASLTTITHSRPAILPMPVIIPAPGIGSEYTSCAARADNSRNGECGSRRWASLRFVDEPNVVCVPSQRVASHTFPSAIASLCSSSLQKLWDLRLDGRQPASTRGLRRERPCSGPSLETLGMNGRPVMAAQRDDTSAGRTCTRY